MSQIPLVLLWTTKIPSALVISKSLGATPFVTCRAAQNQTYQRCPTVQVQSSVNGCKWYHSHITQCLSNFEAAFQHISNIFQHLECLCIWQNEWCLFLATDVGLAIIPIHYHTAFRSIWIGCASQVAPEALFKKTSRWMWSSAANVLNANEMKIYQSVNWAALSQTSPHEMLHLPSVDEHVEAGNLWVRHGRTTVWFLTLVAWNHLQNTSRTRMNQKPVKDCQRLSRHCQPWSTLSRLLQTTGGSGHWRPHSNAANAAKRRAFPNHLGIALAGHLAQSQPLNASRHSYAEFGKDSDWA